MVKGTNVSDLLGICLSRKSGAQLPDDASFHSSTNLARNASHRKVSRILDAGKHVSSSNRTSADSSFGYSLRAFYSASPCDMTSSVSFSSS